MIYMHSCVPALIYDTLHAHQYSKDMHIYNGESAWLFPTHIMIDGQYPLAKLL